MMAKPIWQVIARQVQSHRDESISRVTPPLPRLDADLPRDVTAIPACVLSPREIQITQSATEVLVESLADGRLKSLEVTNAFLRRAALAQKLTNCLTELLPERAIARAQELDAYFTEHKRPMGPLHGVPISVKEYIGMKGLGYNAGFVAWVGTTAGEDALSLKVLWNAGCVFFARTTQPQTLMHLETASNLYGVTVNPFNRALSSGGSSGGEGALIGMRGSCLGLGSDIGGSIRSPAANNGIYGLRPTSLRVPRSGGLVPKVGWGYIPGVQGPLSTSIGGIKLFMKTMLDAQPWLNEPTVVPLPWRDGPSRETWGESLKVGVMWDDGIVTPHPPVARALREVVGKLKHVPGVEIVNWEPYKHDLAWEIIASLYYLDGGKETTEVIDASQEPWLPLSTFRLKETPQVKQRTLLEIETLVTMKNEYMTAYAQKWNSTATGANREGMVDVILCPATPGVAPLLDTSRYWCYTSQWNLLDYPALVFPVSTVDQGCDVRDTAYSPMNEQDAYNHNLYSGPEEYTNAPVSLQLVGRRYEDEKVISIFEHIQQQIGLPFTNALALPADV